MILLGCSNTLAQSRVWVDQFLLTQEKGGWRVAFPTLPGGKHSLQPGDLITRLDGENAGEMGPLAVNAAFNDARDRTVPAILIRNGQPVNMDLWLHDKRPAPSKGVPPKKAVSRAQQAPDFNLPTLQNVPIHLSDLRGRWVLVNFFATWCGPCKEEAKVFSRLMETYSQLTVLALSVGDTRKDLEEFARDVKPTYAILDAGTFSSQPALDYGVGTLGGGASVPVGVLVRPDGDIAYVQTGFGTPTMLQEQVSYAMAQKQRTSGKN